MNEQLDCFCMTLMIWAASERARQRLFPIQVRGLVVRDYGLMYVFGLLAAYYGLWSVIVPFMLPL